MASTTPCGGRCANPNCTWKIPEDYQNSLTFSEEERSAEKIQEIYNNCLAIHSKDFFYVDWNGELNGCSRFNIPFRIYIAIKNYWDNGETERAALIKIEETFRYVLRISASIDMADHNGSLNPTSFDIYAIRIPYTQLVTKIREKYLSEESAQNLTSLEEALEHITHIKPVDIPKTYRTVLNTQSNAVGTAWESTTVWIDA